MTRKSPAQTLWATTGIGLLGGIVGGIWLYLAITNNAEAHAQSLDPMMRASYMCSAGTAGSWLALFSLPIGAIFGLCLGGVFLRRQRAAERRPLP